MSTVGTEARATRAEQSLQRIEAVAWLLDDAILVPGTRFRFGFDPILGLIPGIGDLLSAGLQFYVVIEAAQAGVPVRTLARMLINVLFDSLLGGVPVLGKVLDFFVKSNRRNLELVHEALRR